MKIKDACEFVARCLNDTQKEKTYTSDDVYNALGKFAPLVDLLELLVKAVGYYTARVIISDPETKRLFEEAKAYLETFSKQVNRHA